MECATIPGFILNKKSEIAAQRIRRMREVGEHLPKLLATGTFANIFAGSKPLEASYNITSTDWHHLALALRAAPEFVRSRIKAQAEAMVLEFEFNYEPKQREFWRAVADGCTP